MKQRILAIAVALCVCLSSQSVAYAFQENPSQETLSQQEEVPTEETQDEEDNGDKESISKEENTSQKENSPKEEGSSQKENSSQQEDTLPEETPDEDEAEADDEGDSLKQEDSAKQEETAEDSSDEEKVIDEEDLLQQEDQLEKEDTLTEETPDEDEADTADEKSPSPRRATSRRAVRSNTVPSPSEAYEAMIALKEQDAYKEGTIWTNDEPYTDGNYYRWNGGPLGGKNIVAVGCVAFAFILSDEAFGSLPARMYAEGEFSYEDIKVGDILRVNNDVHTVIVLEVRDTGVVVAEGNISTGDHKGKVHWGRGISKEEVMRGTSHYITRYPEGYNPPDDSEADESVASGTLDTGLTWNLTKSNTLTISGQGAMPDFDSAAEQPWSDYSSQIREVVIEEGVTSIGACAFWDCGVIGAEIASSVERIGNSAFQGSQLISVTIPSGVKTIGDSAFYKCQNMSSVTVHDGVETIGQNAFNACTRLSSIELPGSIGEVGAAAFFQCGELRNVTFAPGSKQVKMGDNMFMQCYKLMGVTLPARIDRISEGMFQNCMFLVGLEIPQGTQSIGGSAFASCSGLSTLVIPDSVTSIGIAAFSNCSLQDIYYTGSEAQWKSISKIGDTSSAVSKVTIHYDYVPDDPDPDPTPDPGEGDDNPGGGDNNTGGDNGNNTGGNKPGNNGGNTSNGSHSGSSSGSNTRKNKDSDSNRDNYYSDRTSSIVNTGISAVVQTWKPATPEEQKRYDCLGKEAVQYIPAKDNAYQVTVENAMQGAMCFQSFEAVLEDYTIGRTYNIYSPSGNMYSMDKEIQLTMKIPSDIYKANREYRMICVTKGGQPIVYKDLDNNPETITIQTNKFYAYALIYK